MYLNGKILRRVSLLGLWAVELNDGILAGGHPVWILGGELLSLARLQADLNVGFQSSQATQRRRPKPSECSVKAHRVLPVPVARQLPVVEVAFEQHQVGTLESRIQVGSVGCHVAELVGLGPERMVVVGPLALLQVALPLRSALGHPPVIDGHGLTNGPQEIFGSHVRHEPREGLAVKTDLASEPGGNQEICKDQVSD